ncbi:MAG: NAD-dependent epimerase/dehydratase family protein [Candidatus Firestonebacteria bacterium]
MGRKSKVVITGGAGFIGSHIGDILIENGYEVFALDNLSSGKKTNLNPKARLVAADITGAETSKKLKLIAPEYIIHAAAQISVSRSMRIPRADAETNIMGTLNLLEYARLNGVKKFIFASSGGTIYGDPSPLSANEKMRYDPISPYAIGKAVIEWYLRFYLNEYKLPYISLRYSNVYGPRQDPHGEAGVVAIFCKKLMAGETCTINGDGKYVRDYVYCKDVARANLMALQAKNTGGFNVCTNISTDTNQLYGKIVKAMGIKKEAVHGPARAGDLRKSVLSYGKIKKEIGWKPAVDLEQGIKETVKYFQDKS